jgi:DNA-binding transcriptional LysR family regulator
MADFDWNDLRAFLAVVRTGRLTTAALQLGIDHSTLSRRIIGLEKALRTRLFNRRPTGYVLTGAGENLIAEAEAVESLTIRIAAQIVDPNAGLSGSVRIATPEGFGTYFLTQHIGALARQYPTMTIELVANPTVVNLSKREADIAVTMSRPAKGKFRARKLLDYELGLYASQTYLAKEGKPARLEDVDRYGLIGYIKDILPTPHHDYLKELFGARSPDIGMSNVLTQLHATIHGAGLCVLPHFMADVHAELTRVLPQEVRITRSYWLVVHAETRAPARSRVVGDFLQDIAHRHRRTFLPEID